uniref:Uncharacterized protein n=1 Tax=Arundo donax TaxID=35708 RepID=A0A0A9DEL5_ARUDO
MTSVRFKNCASPSAHKNPQMKWFMFLHLSPPPM